VTSPATTALVGARRRVAGEEHARAIGEDEPLHDDAHPRLRREPQLASIGERRRRARRAVHGRERVEELARAANVQDRGMLPCEARRGAVLADPGGPHRHRPGERREGIDELAPPRFVPSDDAIDERRR
jgi:hypothetical protein